MDDNKDGELGILARRRIEAAIIAPVYDEMRKAVGEDKARDILRRAIRRAAIDAGTEMASRAAGGADLESFKAILPLWTKDDALTIEVVDDKRGVFDFNVRRCRYAETYRAMGLGEIGDILSCNRDAAFCEGYDRRIKLTRTQTIMGGASHCDFRYRADPPQKTPHGGLEDGANVRIVASSPRAGGTMRPSWFLIAFLTALAAVSPARALERLIDISNDRWVEVSGEGSVTAAPDFARVTVGVTRTGRNAGEAMTANANAANALVSLIKAEGVPPADIQTSDMSISPTFAQSTPGQKTSPAIVGYSVSNNLTVVVRDISRLGALLDKAVGAGANSIYGIGFGHNNPSALLDKARPLAVADARRKAEIYAGAGGARSGRLMVLTENGGPQEPVAFSRAYAGAATSPPPIEAGEDRLTVTVTARFELTQ